MRTLLFLASSVVISACTGKAGSERAPTEVAAKADAKSDAKPSVPRDPAPEARAQPPADPPANPPTDPSAAAPPDAKADRGLRFVDPKWFRKTIFEDATKVDFQRSQADDRGLFSSQMLFDLKEGTTREACAKTVEDKVGGTVTNLAREVTPERITIKGNTDRYKMIAICGEAKGVMKAYVSLLWTS